MKRFLFFAVTLFLSLSQAQFAVGNGGDIVRCTPQAGSPFNGDYSLDFLVTYQISNQYKVLPVSSLKSSLERIYKLLTLKAPALAKNFYEFARNYKNTTQFTEKYIWEMANYGLTDLKDERLVSLFPPNCVSGGKVQLIQAIIRQVHDINGSTKLFFKYDPRIIDPIEKNNPLQISFLVVHEWLWNYLANVESLRKINWFIHTDALEKLPASEVQKQLTALGLILPQQDPKLSSLSLDCKTDTTGLQDIFNRIFKGKNYQEFSFARFEPLVLTRACSDMAGCGDPILKSSPSGLFSKSQNYFGESLFVSASLAEAGSVGINLVTGQNKSHVFNQCIFNVINGQYRCNNMYLWKDLSTTNMQMEFSMNRECLKIVSTQRYSVVYNKGHAFWYEEEFIVFSRFRLDQF